MIASVTTVTTLPTMDANLRAEHVGDGAMCRRPRLGGAHGTMHVQYRQVVLKGFVSVPDALVF